jgi:hypothetical protein
MREDVSVGPVGGQVQADAPCIARDHGGQLEQLDAQPLDEHAAQRGQQYPQLVALQVLATRARGKQAHLRFLDAVLGRAALAVQVVVQRLWIAWENMISCLPIVRRSIVLSV